MPHLKELTKKLYVEQGRKILKFILKRNGGDLQVAEEILHETFIAFLKSYKGFQHKSSFFTWLCKIALNKLADYYRKEVNYRSKVVIPSVEVFNQIIDPKISTEEKMSLDDLKTKVNQCLDLLPPKYRQLLHLKYYEELSHSEICLKLQLTSRQLEGQLYRARKAFAKFVF